MCHLSPQPIVGAFTCPVPEHSSMTTVLLADDSAIVRKLLRRKISAITQGYQVDFLEASDGAQALQALLDEDIDLALIDYNMPEFNGVEVITRFKAAQSDRNPYLFMVTTEASSSIVMAAVKAGAHNYIVKNNLDDAFAKKISALLLPEGAHKDKDKVGSSSHSAS
ncbi:MAG: response regulator [Planctomycetota bacterium]|nr:MAG: response regulator [Planctomycetota bacterium]